MKANKVFSIAALIICGMVCVNSVKADAPSNTDNVTVNIIFKPIQSIQVNPLSEKVVDFVYETPADYVDGVAVQKLDDHLIVSSTGKFIVQVKGEDFTGGAFGDIAAGDVTVQASVGSDNPLDLTPAMVSLSTGNTNFIESPSGGGMNLKFNVAYGNPGGANSEYINKAEDAETTYTATVTYTILSQ